MRNDRLRHFAEKRGVTGPSWSSRALRLCLAACVLAIPSSARARQSATHEAGQANPASAPHTPADAPTAQVQPAPKPPIPNRANELLPSWIRVRGEFRERMEGFDGAGFDDAREDLYWLSRFRFDARVTPSKMLAFYAQVQDARVGKKTVGPTGAPFRAPFDLRMAFADIGSASSPVSVRLGRQELVYGEQRLVGHVSWLNAARTFDAAKITIRTALFQVEAFGASLVRILDGEIDRSGAGNRFAGVYATTTTFVPRSTIEPYVFFKRDVRLRGESGSIGDLNETTVGVRIVGKLLPRLDYGTEMAVQRGSLGPEEVQAWAGHWRLRSSLPGPGAARLTGEYNYASGDEDPTDGIRGTFDQLYPTPHDKYGLADQVGWKNIHHLRAGFELTPLSGLPITTNYHSWWLASRRDALYAAGSAVLARINDGATSSHVGHELDFQIARPITPQIQLAAGYAHIFTGDFLKQATPGASYSHPYVLVTYVFLAER
ncbi:MAG: alginate export family protein [Vicinamibacterales bacterium]